MNSTEELPQDAVHGLLAGAFDPAGRDLPAVDLVPGAVSGFEKHRRRTRVLGAGASVAVLGISAAAYAMVPRGGSSASVEPGKAPTTPAVAPPYDIFADAGGSPDSLCKGNWMDIGLTPAQDRQNCLVVLPLLRELFAGDKVVPTHVVAYEDPVMVKAGLRAILADPAVGVPHPVIAAEWSRIMSDPSSKYNIMDSGEYSAKTADGTTFGFAMSYTPKGPNHDPNQVCVDGKAAGSGVPCWSLTLADGDKATFVTYPMTGSFEGYVTTATGGQFTVSVNWEVGRYAADTSPGGKHYFDFATGTAHDDGAPQIGRFTKEQFSALLQSKGFADLKEKYVAGVETK